MKYLFVLLSTLILRADLSAQTNFIHSQDWESIKEKAENTGKLIFVDAYTDWCGWCKVMDDKTFSNEAIGNMMNQYFINVKLEMEKEDLGKQLALKYAVASFPSYLIFNGKGELIFRTGGYQEPGAFMNTLFAIINPENHKQRPGYSQGFDVRYPDFYLKAMGMTRKKKFPEKAEINEWIATNNDLGKEENWAVFQRFSYFMNGTNRALFWNQIPVLDSLYGHDLVADLTETMIYMETQDMVEKNDPASFEAMLKAKLPLMDKPEQKEKWIRLHYANETKNWADVNKMLSSRFNEEGAANASFWNQQCWDIYEKCPDTLLIQNAVIWMKEVVKIEPDFNYIDTYAALLYKAGELQEAKLEAKRAIDVGTKANKNVKETEALLEKIEATIIATEALKSGSE